MKTRRGRETGRGDRAAERKDEDYDDDGSLADIKDETTSWTTLRTSRGAGKARVAESQGQGGAAGRGGDEEEERPAD